MAPPDLRWLDDQLQPITTPPAYTLVPGGRSNIVDLHIVNNPDGIGASDTAYNHLLIPQERNAGETEWHADGRPLVDHRRIEVQILGGVDGLDIGSTSWIPVGAGRPLSLPALADGQGIRLRTSVVSPLDQPAADKELYFGIDDGSAISLPIGLSEAVGDGVYLGLGDGRVTSLLHAGQITQAPVPDDTVEIVDVFGWLSAGLPHTDRNRFIQLDDQAADGQLAVGEAYWALLHTSASGQIEVVKGNKGIDPRDESARPPLPDATAESALAYVYRDDSGVITNADITAVWQVEGGAFSAQGLAGELGPSTSLVGNRWIRHDAPEAVSLAPTSTVSIWRLPTGGLGTTTDGSRPDPEALLLWEVDTDTTDVTAVRRRHRWLQRSQQIDFVFDEPLTGALVRYAQPPVDHSVYLAPIPGQVTATVFDAGTGASGASEWGIDYAEPGVPATWVSILDAADRPSVQWDTATRTSAAAMPSVITLPAGCLLRCRLVGEVDAGWPTGAVVSTTLMSR